MNEVDIGPPLLPEASFNAAVDMRASSDSDEMGSSRSGVSGSSCSLELEEADGADIPEDGPLDEGVAPEEEEEEEEEEERDFPAYPARRSDPPCR